MRRLTDFYCSDPIFFAVTIINKSPSIPIGERFDALSSFPVSCSKSFKAVLHRVRSLRLMATTLRMTIPLRSLWHFPTWLLLAPVTAANVVLVGLSVNAASACPAATKVETVVHVAALRLLVAVAVANVEVVAVSVNAVRACPTAAKEEY
jgi:hypothetical protein